MRSSRIIPIIVILLVIGGLGVPVWLLIAIAIAGIVSVVRQRRRLEIQRLETEGFCSKCRYDLHGNISGTCPECGAPVQQPTDVEGTT